MLYPIIIAGGQGTRLWPVSRKQNPKQLKPFLDEKTLLRKTYERFLQIVPQENIFLATTKILFDSVKNQLPEMPDENILQEPYRRDTAPALGLALFKLYEKDKNAVFVYANSDNFIKDEKAFKKTLQQAEEYANEDKVILIGVQPKYPETGYGYIEMGELKTEAGEHKLYSIKNFKEKPDKQTAEQYLTQGNYLWNPTLIVSKVKVFLDLYQKHLPDTYKKLKEISAYFGTAEQEQKIKKIFPQIVPISIDYGILEKAGNMFVMKADFGWIDVGHWKAIFDILKKDEDSNVSTGFYKHIDSRENLIYSKSKRLITTIGVSNMIIVETDDALLICPKQSAQKVKELVGLLKKENYEKFI